MLYPSNQHGGHVAHSTQDKSHMMQAFRRKDVKLTGLPQHGIQGRALNVGLAGPYAFFLLTYLLTYSMVQSSS